MNTQIRQFIVALNDNYNGKPWHGRSIRSLLGEVTPEIGLKKPNPASHSIAELIYHMANWRDFTITRIKPEEGKDSKYFDVNDWRTLDLTSFQTWELGLQLLEESQRRLISILNETDDSILSQPVGERKYNFHYLLSGLLQHDVYHTGQIAYAMKLLS
ncbi:MAG TPA: DinB family protein [Chitinophagaceae bacterium]